MRKTRTLEHLPKKRPFASGVRVSDTRTLYIFGSMTPKVTIGAAARCDIRLDSPFVSGLHAQLTYRDGAMWLEDRSTQGTTFIDGWAIGDKAVALLVGMEIQLGRTVLTATDEDGMLPVLASTPSEMSAKASAQYGSYRLAADFLKRSHSTIIRHTRRYKARMARKKVAEEHDGDTV